jgi:hypothetical protein
LAGIAVWSRERRISIRYLNLQGIAAAISEQIAI